MYRYSTVADMYHDMSSRLFAEGNKVCPRNQQTYELIAPEIHIEHPISNLVYLKERRFNLVYAIVESLLLISKVNNVKYFSRFNQNMKNYSDDGEILNGAYGYRIADNIDYIVERLKSDKDSRQAVLTIYQNDVNKITKDPPCTLNLHFLIRDNKLCLINYMRSNDIIWGTPYDMFMFTTLQTLVAYQLDIEPGWYKHIPSSLHVYSQHYELLMNMKNCEPVSTYFPFNLNNYRIMASDYVHYIDTGEIRGTDAFKPHENAGNYEARKIMQLIYNEEAYRDGDLDLISKEIPSWSKKFVTRWYK